MRTCGVQLLPASLQTRLADDHCNEAIRRNMHLFAGCDIQFRLRFMMHLQVFSLSLAQNVLALPARRASGTSLELNTLLQSTRVLLEHVCVQDVYLMPGEPILKQDEIARELNFVTKGTLVVTDTNDVLIELKTGEGTASSVVGEVSFLMGMSTQPNEPEVTNV